MQVARRRGSVSEAALDLFDFFFNDTATTEIYTLSLHDALPIFPWLLWPSFKKYVIAATSKPRKDRKSTRLNSSHVEISYAVFCLKKQKHAGKANDVAKRQRDKHKQSTADPED